MSINNELVSFASKKLILARNASERERINTSIDNLKYNLEYYLGDYIEDFILFGSYTRNTILPRVFDPNSDIDLMVVFNADDRHYSPNTYRNWILKVVSKCYPRSISKKDFPVIKLELNHIMFDIVPAYSTCNLWSDTQYYIPNFEGSWRKTNPNDINDDLAEKNNSYGDNVIRNVIRLCKHWNAGAGYPLKSYLMEKKIIDLVYWGNENTYERFLKTLNSIAGNYIGVRQALDKIDKYNGGIFNSPNEDQQFRLLQKLLPGLI